MQPTTQTERSPQEQRLQDLVDRDVAILLEKQKTYGDSWKKRGGPGAFMVTARKWDRIENIVSALGYDIFKAGEADIGGILDDIADLRAYLTLIQEHIESNTQL